ncbi:MAG TPA: class I SAM-dependent methyltransferase [Candidatus Binatia bacterium]|nr:class I SAM-dependent methyltransferase [Candidatus Binatia bacterium]
MANDRAFYEQLWGGFRSPWVTQLAIHRESRRPLLKLLSGLLPEPHPARALEVGCGTALESCLLAAMHPGLGAFACDLSENALHVACANGQALGIELRAFAGDLTALPFADASFDLVFSQGVLEHFTDPAPAMREQLRVLRPGGALVVDVPQKFNVYTLRKHQAMRNGCWAWGWETEYSAAELRAWAPRYGLEVAGAVGYQHGRFVDRLLVHPHRTLRRLLARAKGLAWPNGYRPGLIARQWESLWDAVDERLGPYLAINVAVAFRKPAALLVPPA